MNYEHIQFEITDGIARHLPRQFAARSDELDQTLVSAGAVGAARRPPLDDAEPVAESRPR